MDLTSVYGVSNSQVSNCEASKYVTTIRDATNRANNSKKINQRNSKQFGSEDLVRQAILHDQLYLNYIPVIVKTNLFPKFVFLHITPSICLTIYECFSFMVWCDFTFFYENQNIMSKC